MRDLGLDVEDLAYRIENIRLRGCKGTTGTQASFLELFKGDHAKVRELERLIAEKLGVPRVFPVTGQTYSRKADAAILDILSGVSQSCAKMGTDLRLLQHEGELLEPLESDQIGPVRWPTRNPMRAERIADSPASDLLASSANTAATQWLERTLDDSANRRLTLPEAFLAPTRSWFSRPTSPRGSRYGPTQSGSTSMNRCPSWPRNAGHARRRGGGESAGVARGDPHNSFAAPRSGSARVGLTICSSGSLASHRKAANAGTQGRLVPALYTGRAEPQVGELAELRSRRWSACDRWRPRRAQPRWLFEVGEGRRKGTGEWENGSEMETERGTRWIAERQD
jgi:hypothetical protein